MDNSKRESKCTEKLNFDFENDYNVNFDLTNVEIQKHQE